MKPIYVAGNICLDITPHFTSREPATISALFKPGSMLNMNGVNIHTGGCVANTGLALSILGADVILRGKVGNDDFGKMILSLMERYNAADHIVVADNQRSSYSIVLAPPGIDRIFLHDQGASDVFGYDDIDFDNLESCSVFHLGYPPIMRQLYLNNGDTLLRIMKTAKEHGVVTSMDMCAIDDNAEHGKVDWPGLLSTVLPYVDVFVPSIDELLHMLDRGMHLALASGEISLDDCLDVISSRLLAMGVKIVLIKCGEHGLYLRTGSKDVIRDIASTLGLDVKKWADKAIRQHASPVRHIVSATGAGDTAIAGFLRILTADGEVVDAGHTYTKSPESAALYAAEIGARCLRGYDALSGLKGD